MKRMIAIGVMLLITQLASTTLYADSQTDNSLFVVARSGDLVQLEQLLEQGGNPNSTNAQGFTPLILAAYYGHIPLVERLIQSGSKACAVDSKGSNAMMGAAFRGHIDMIQCLLENANCDVNHRNLAGQTTLMMAALCGREDIIDLLMKYDADPSIQDAAGNRAASLAMGQGQQLLAEKLK